MPRHLISTDLSPLDTVTGAVAAFHPDGATDLVMTANLAYFNRITVPSKVSVNRLVLRIGSATSGNIDIGLYSNVNGLPAAKLVSSGSTAAAAVGTRQAFTIAETALTIGVYWVAIVADNSVLSLAYNARAGAFFKTQSQATAFPLPANATPVDATNIGALCFSVERA